MEGVCTMRRARRPFEKPLTPSSAKMRCAVFTMPVYTTAPLGPDDGGDWRPGRRTQRERDFLGNAGNVGGGNLELT